MLVFLIKERNHQLVQRMLMNYTHYTVFKHFCSERALFIQCPGVLKATQTNSIQYQIIFSFRTAQSYYIHLPLAIYFL